MSQSGAVKSYNASKGFGFIASSDGSDVFLHVSNVTDGGEPRAGDTLWFDTEPSPKNPGQMQAINVTGCSGVPGQGADAGMVRIMVKGTGIPGAHQGQVKSFAVKTGFGFAVGPDGTDVFVHVNAVVDGGIPRMGDILTFDIEASKQKEGQFLAVNISGGTGSENDKGGGKGRDKPTGIPGAHQGTVKSFAVSTGFGFATCPDGTDVFIHINSCVDGSVPRAGDILQLDIEPSKNKEGKFNGVNITGGSGTEDGKGGKGDPWSKGGGKDAWGGWGKEGGKGGWGMEGGKGGWGMDGGKGGWGMEGCKGGWGKEGMKGWGKGW